MAQLHIASCVAFVRPEAREAVRAAIEDSGLAEVPRSDGHSRLILLFERPTSGAVLDGIDAIRSLPGVIAVHLAYQHAEDAAALQESS